MCRILPKYLLEIRGQFILPNTATNITDSCNPTDMLLNETCIIFSNDNHIVDQYRFQMFKGPSWP